jgi:hypothetical protein
VVLASLLIASAGAIFAHPVQAQPTPQVQPAPEETGSTIWQKGGCFNCHGNLADGDGDPAYPVGPNLRATALGRDQLLETISCGLPSTPMPFNLAGAYTETPCYGLPLGEPPDVGRGAGLTAEQLLKLVDFLEEEVVGVRRITRENCGAFFGGNVDAPLCRQY